MATHQGVYISLAVDPLPLQHLQEQVCARFALSPRSELHVTLGFLGEVEDERLAALARELSVLSPEPLETLKIAGTGGVFQDTSDPEGRLVPITCDLPLASFKEYPRVLWWAVEPSEALLRCHQALRGALEGLGMGRLPTLFSPHVTIGSFPGAAAPDLRSWDVYDVEKLATLGSLPDPGSVTVERLHITKSELHPQSLLSIVESGRPAGVVVWLTGWPGSGKSTLARALRRRLAAEGQESVLLDSDEVRERIFPALGYADEDRGRFYASLTRMAGLLAEQGLIVLVAATASRRSYREEARRALPRFIEVYLSTPRDEGAARDPKGLYQQGKIDFAYEPPLAPEVTLPGATDAAGLTRILELIRELRSASDDRTLRAER